MNTALRTTGLAVVARKDVFAQPNQCRFRVMAFEESNLQAKRIIATEPPVGAVVLANLPYSVASSSAVLAPEFLRSPIGVNVVGLRPKSGSCLQQTVSATPNRGSVHNGSSHRWPRPLRARDGLSAPASLRLHWASYLIGVARRSREINASRERESRSERKSRMKSLENTPSVPKKGQLEEFDLVILGGGTGATLAAWTFASEGKRVAIISPLGMLRLAGQPEKARNSRSQDCP